MVRQVTAERQVLLRPLGAEPVNLCQIGYHSPSVAPLADR